MAGGILAPGSAEEAAGQTPSKGRSKVTLRLTAISRAILIPAIFMLCVVAAFAIASRAFDIWILPAFGPIGFALRLAKYPIATLVRGLELGELLDSSLRRGPVLSDGSLLPFFDRPMSLMLAAVIVLIVALQIPAVRRTLAPVGNGLRFWRRDRRT